MMKHGTYVGPIPVIKGKTALLKPSNVIDHVKAQFDDMDLPALYTYGWIDLPHNHFKIEENEAKS